MRFSVVVPVYNVAPYLPECMESLLAQTCRDMEIILVDDGSTDAGGMLCDGYAAAYPELVQVIHQKNGGLGAARNTGLEAARGEYLLFVDSDDYIRPESLAVLSDAVDRTDADMIVFSFSYLYENRTEPGPVSRFAGQKPFVLEEHPELLLEAPNAWMRITRRDLWINRGFRFPPRAWYEDLRTTGKLLAECRSIAVLPDRLYLYRQRENSIMRSPNLRRNLEIIDAVEDLRLYFARQGLTERYGSLLCTLAVDQMILAAQRVLMADPAAAFLPEFVKYLDTAFPGYHREPTVETLGKKKMIVLSLLRGRRYRLLKGIFGLRSLLRGRRNG